MRTHFTALRMLLLLSVALGIGYPLFVTGIAQLPGLRHQADGSTVTVHGRTVGSSLLGQNFTDAHGNPLPQYFQPRPSTGDYDPTASGASNLGPESIVGERSLLSQVCARSLAVGRFNGVDGSRPYCTSGGVGAVLAVFWSGPGFQGAITNVVSVNQLCPATPFLHTYKGVPVECASVGADYAAGQVVPIRGTAPAHPAVPADAVTASGSGLDPDISPAYAHIQEERVARARGVSVVDVESLVRSYTAGRELGFLGEPRVNVLQLNIAMDEAYPQHTVR